MQTTKPTPFAYYTQPQPKPLPTTAPATRRTAPLLTEAEQALNARKIALLQREIARLEAAKAGLRNEQLRLIYEIANGADLDGISIDECEFCHGFHEGICNS